MTAPAPAPRVMRPARPRLAEALAVVTAYDVEAWRRRVGSPRFRLTDTGVVVNEYTTHYDAAWTITDPAEAWEALAARGVIPMAWVGDARRWFRWSDDHKHGCSVCRGERIVPTGPNTRAPCYHCRGTGVGRVGAWPETVAACVALASDPRGVETAEALARQGTGCERVVWRVAPRAEAERVAARDQVELPRRPGQRRWLAYTDNGALRDLRELGYAVDALTDDAMVLVCPEVAGG